LDCYLDSSQDTEEHKEIFIGSNFIQPLEQF